MHEQLELLIGYSEKFQTMRFLILQINGTDLIEYQRMMHRFTGQWALARVTNRTGDDTSNGGKVLRINQN